MTHEFILRENAPLKDDIIKLIQNNHSSVSLIAEYLDTEEDLVRTIILEAVKEEKIQGKLSDDESRFYRSDVKMPDLSSVNDEENIVPPSLLIPKIITLGGFILFVAGQIIIRMTVEGTSMHNISTMLVFGGLFTIFGGLYSFSRFGSK